MNEIVMSYEKILPDGQGALKPNKDGEFRVRLGGVNVFNASGIFYKDGIGEYCLEDAIKNDGENGKKMSMLNQKIKNNCLFGEAGHPNWEPGYTEDKFLERNLFIDPKCIAFSIRKLYWVPTNQNVDRLGIGGNIVWIEADIFPCGPYGDSLKQLLMSDKENVAFSIRTLVDTQIINGVRVRVLRDIVTWDQVCQPGIAKANKLDYLSERLSVESLKHDYLTDSRTLTFSKESLKNALEGLKNRQELGLESIGIEDGIRICEKYLDEPKNTRIIKW